MLKFRKSDDRGAADHGWLKSRHTFSFADYRDPNQMGFRSLRVINEDRIAGGTGFGSHPHRDMEIISYVVKGGLQHKDSMGTVATILPGEVQRMSAGTGVVHSEHNAHAKDETHFFQIWIQPHAQGLKPGYGQKSFATELATRELVLVVSMDGRDGSISINQDADMYISRLKTNAQLEFHLRPTRGVWIQVIQGTLAINSQNLNSGDAVAIENEASMNLKAQEECEFILFDLA